MRLTTLEIKGFKSFGDKVIIHFDKGVTSVVGPNGSGKSNVVDAMRWVLGEQKTRMLRSEKMENIIFNGTKTRKPANVAEVSITFENTKNILPTEYSTVTITRRLYRNGDSEYLLNGVPCRLKDITDLFMDTGIGPDSYSIIELKMVDEILNDKHNNIKLLFEEAAGISKYKIRKKQTLSKLEDTDGDLNRVNDLLFEIEKNLKLLESQAKKTERFYKIRDQYKELSVELAVFTLAGNKSTFDDLQKQEDHQQQDRIRLETQIAESEATLQHEKLEALELEKSLAEAQRLLNDQVNTIRQNEHDKKISNERLKYLQDKENQLQQQLSNDKASLLNTQNNIRNLDLEKLNEELLYSKITEELAELKTLLDKARENHDALKSEVAQSAQATSAIQIQMHESEKSFAVSQAKKDSLNAEITRLNIEIEKNVSDHELILKKAGDAKAEKDLKEHELESLISTEEGLTGTILYMEEELKKSSDLVMNHGRALDAKENEYKLIKSLVDNLEGYPESLKFIKKSNTPASRAPLLSDIISCKSDFKSTLEIYLDSFMNYFVIEDIESASTAVNLLSTASQGRANFFILENFKNYQAKTLPPIPKCIPVMQVLEVDDKYKNLCAYLLDKVYVVLDDQEQTPFLQQENQQAVFLSLNGKFCRTPNSLSGGSVGLFDGKRIGRTRQLEQLHQEIDVLRDTLSNTKDIHQSLQNDLIETKQRKEKITSGKNKLQQELNVANHDFSSHISKAETIKTNIENQHTLIDGLDKQLGVLTNALLENNLSHQEYIDQLKTGFEQANKKLSEVQQKFHEAAGVLEMQNHEYNQKHIQSIQEQNKIATLTRDLNYNTNLRETVELNIRNNSIELENVQAQVLELINSSTGYDAQLLDLYAEKEKKETQVSISETEFYKARGFIDESETKIRQLRHSKDQVDQLTQALKDRSTELKIQLNSLKERLEVEFNIEISNLLERTPSPDWSEEELREKVGRLKSQIDNYGPINPMAIEAFNEIKERHTFIINQKDDLLKAKESLLQTISEIENAAQQNFMEAFAKIRANFIHVFRSLFTDDDDCDLVLLDAGNPTESDVQIIAKPKGKRPLSISQLSGGEKTLTAIALLFGIYLLKPAPFCIFDEVDAPLDDTNIDKFNNIIKKFSSDSQFILITHNKRTMTATDIIYGVTMSEPGVTQMVPVDLTEMAEA